MAYKSIDHRKLPSICQMESRFLICSAGLMMNPTQRNYQLGGGGGGGGKLTVVLRQWGVVANACFIGKLATVKRLKC